MFRMYISDGKKTAHLLNSVETVGRDKYPGTDWVHSGESKHHCTQEAQQTLQGQADTIHWDKHWEQMQFHLHCDKKAKQREILVNTARNSNL